jgi:hypothetical protein
MGGWLGITNCDSVGGGKFVSRGIRIGNGARVLGLERHDGLPAMLRPHPLDAITRPAQMTLSNAIAYSCAFVLCAIIIFGFAFKVDRRDRKREEDK